MAIDFQHWFSWNLAFCISFLTLLPTLYQVNRSIAKRSTLHYMRVDRVERRISGLTCWSDSLTWSNYYINNYLKIMCQCNLAYHFKISGQRINNNLGFGNSFFLNTPRNLRTLPTLLNIFQRLLVGNTFTIFPTFV